MFSQIVYVIITNEEQVTILQAYKPLLRHICRSMIIRRNIAPDLCAAGGCQQFRKESRKRPRRIMVKTNYSFFHHCLLYCRCVMFQKQYFEETKTGGTSSR